MLKKPLFSGYSAGLEIPDIRGPRSDDTERCAVAQTDESGLRPKQRWRIAKVRFPADGTAHRVLKCSIELRQVSLAFWKASITRKPRRVTGFSVVGRAISP